MPVSELTCSHSRSIRVSSEIEKPLKVLQDCLEGLIVRSLEHNRQIPGLSRLLHEVTTPSVNGAETIAAAEAADRLMDREEMAVSLKPIPLKQFLAIQVNTSAIHHFDNNLITQLVIVKSYHNLLPERI